MLAEKESWSRPAAGGESSDAVRAQLETEKAQLTKARDEALERLKVYMRRVTRVCLLMCYVRRLPRNARTRRLTMLEISGNRT